MKKELTMTLIFALALVATALGIFRNASAVPVLVALSAIAVAQLGLIGFFVKRLILR